MSSEAELLPREHAAFAVISRLISCLVTEQLLRAFYVPASMSNYASGAMVILSTHLLSEQSVIDRAIRASDVFAIVPLHHPPVFQNSQTHKHGRRVGLVDPMDMLPQIYELVELSDVDGVPDFFAADLMRRLVPPPWDFGPQITLRKTIDPVTLWKKFVDGIVIQDKMREIIGKELESSFQWQRLAYEKPPKCPSFQSSAIEWEQSLVAGHPTHPMHRARMLSSGSMEYDWYHPVIRFVRVPISSLDILGTFPEISRSLVEKAASNANVRLPHDGVIYMPVHELQIDNVVQRFPSVELLHPDINLPALAQSSIRTVTVAELPGHVLKLSVGVKISSSLRTISHYTANFGPRFSTEVVPHLAVDPRILAVELEPCSAVFRSDDPETQKHLTVLIRREYETDDVEALIVCAALLENGHSGTPPGIYAVEHVFSLDTQDKRIKFLDRYLQLACKALIPALVHNGVAFEAHAQNVLVRVNRNTGEILGFVIRDLGGLRIHPPTLCRSTGIDFRFLPGHCVATQTLDEIYPKFYHTFVHNHVQRLIRVLKLHYNGIGWELLRKHMGSVIPTNHALREKWLSKENMSVPSKCLMRMRIRDSYRDMVYNPYPNMIQFRPEHDGEAEYIVKKTSAGTLWLRLWNIYLSWSTINFLGV